MKNKNIVIILILLVILMVGCSAASDSYDKHITEESVEQVVEDSDMLSEEMGVEGESSRKNTSENTNQKLIYRANMNVEVTGELDPLIKSIQKFVEEHKGYIEVMEQYTRGYDPITQEDLDGVYMQLRIPHKYHDKAIQTIEEIGHVINKSISVEDVTLQYSDIESTLKMYKIEQDRLLEMLEKETSDIKDIIEIEKRLSEVRIELEKHESARRALKSQVDYDTIELEMTEVRRESDIISKGFGNRMKRAFIKSIDNVIIASQKIVLGIIYMFIPLTIIGSIVGVLYVPGSKLIKRIKSKKKAQKKE